MAGLDFSILYDGTYISISDLFEGVGEGSNSDEKHYQDIKDNYYSCNNKGFYYLKRDSLYHNLAIHQNCPDLDNFFAIQTNGTTMNLPQPVIKGCYPCMSSTPKEDRFLTDYGYITNDGKLITKDVDQNIQLPLVVIALVCGGGGGGGSTSTKNLATRGYSAGSGGAGGVGVLYIKTHGYNNGWYLHYEVGTGGTGGKGGGSSSTSGSDGTPSYLWLSTSQTSTRYDDDDTGSKNLLYRSSYGTGGQVAWFEYSWGYHYYGGAAGYTVASYYSEQPDYIWRKEEIGTVAARAGADYAPNASSEINISYDTFLSPFVSKSFSGNIPTTKTKIEEIPDHTLDYTYRLCSYGGNNLLYLPAVNWKVHLSVDGGAGSSDFPLPEIPSDAYGTGGAGAITLTSYYENQNGTAGANGMIRLIW